MEKNYTIQVNQDAKEKTIFQVLSDTLKLYRKFQYGSSYDFSENYYASALKMLNLCVKKMEINTDIKNDIKPELIQIGKFLKENKGLNTHALQEIKKEYELLCMSIKEETIEKNLNKKQKLI